MEHAIVRWFPGGKDVEINRAVAGRILSAMDRLQMLKEMIVQDPNNQLARYGLGMEYSTRGEVDAAELIAHRRGKRAAGTFGGPPDV